ncbi:MAG: PilN domain-containing protein, partial [Candidatus Omnitrophota bacterium]
PREIYFTTITIEEKKQAVLKDRAFDMSDVFKFKSTLEHSPYFENVKLTYTTTKKDQGREYAEFEVICDYEK